MSRSADFIAFAGADAVRSSWPGINDRSSFRRCCTAMRTAAWPPCNRRCAAAPRRTCRASLLLLIGNVEAAAEILRMLPGQPDFNRLLAATPTPEAPQARLARWVYDYAARRRPFASIDIHNNTGFNPHYSCITRLEPQFVALALLFSRIVVHFQRPLGVHAGGICGALSGDHGRMRARRRRDGERRRARRRTDRSGARDRAIAAAHAGAQRRGAAAHLCDGENMPKGASFSFDGSGADFRFRADLDHLNFSELAAGESFGRLGAKDARLEIHPGDGSCAPDDYFDYARGEMRLSRAAIPAMLTQDPRAIRSDCLCYLMHRIEMDGRRSSK